MHPETTSLLKAWWGSSNSFKSAPTPSSLVAPLSKNVPPYIKAAREPLSYIGINGIGLRRRGFDIDRIQAIEDIYRTLYVLNNNMSQAVKAAELELPSEARRCAVFIRQSDKGIIRGRSAPRHLSQLRHVSRQGLSLRRGTRVVWDNATWSLQGPCAIVRANGSAKAPPLRCSRGKSLPMGQLAFETDHGAVELERWMTSVPAARMAFPST